MNPSRPNGNGSTITSAFALDVKDRRLASVSISEQSGLGWVTADRGS